MQDIIIQVMNQYGYLGIFLLITVENIFPPIPSEAILLLAGFMSTYTQMNLWMMVFISTLASCFGATLLYLLGRLLTMQRLEQWPTSKLGRALHFKKDDLRKARQWFSKKGPFTVLFCRCVPIVRSLISIPAGMARMNFGIFIILTTIGSFIWNAVLIHLGAITSNSWEKVLPYLDWYTKITLVVLTLLFALFFLIFYQKRWKKKKK